MLLGLYLVFRYNSKFLCEKVSVTGLDEPKLAGLVVWPMFEMDFLFMCYLFYFINLCLSSSIFLGVLRSAFTSSVFANNPFVVKLYLFWDMDE